MNAATTRAPAQPDARTRLLDAAMQVIREQGYSATTVDDICGAAGLTKGAFFHHFKSKEDLGVAAATHFAQMAEQLFGGAPYHELADPLDRLLGYIDFRAAILTGPIARLHLPPRHDGAGGLRLPSGDPPGLRDLYRPARRPRRKGHRRREGAIRARRAVERREPRALHPGGAAGLVHSRQGERRPGGRADCVAHLRRYILQLFHRPTDREE